jgi:hypothetical protein
MIKGEVEVLHEPTPHINPTSHVTAKCSHDKLLPNITCREARKANNQNFFS